MPVTSTYLYKIYNYAEGTMPESLTDAEKKTFKGSKGLFRPKAPSWGLWVP